MRRALLLVPALLMLSACGGGNANKPAQTSTTTTVVQPPASATNSTLPPTTITTLATTTTVDPALNGGTEPKQAADGLETAWRANSKPNAAAWADQQAIDNLFKTPYQRKVEGNDGFRFMSCEPNAGFNNAMTCSYTYDGGSIHMIMSNAVGKWRVNKVEYVAD